MAIFNMCDHSRERRRGKFQFTLKALLLVTTVLAVLLSGYTSDWWRGLSRQDYQVLSAALRPYLSRSAPEFSILAERTKSLSEIVEFCPPDISFQDGLSSIPDLKDETLRSFVNNNRKSYVIARRLDGRLRYTLANFEDVQEIGRLVGLQAVPYVVFVSRPGFDSAGQQAIVYVMCCVGVRSSFDRGQLMILSNESGAWRTIKTLEVVNLRRPRGGLGATRSSGTP